MNRPVLIHRAILGSVERMMAVLIEHTAGKWYEDSRYFSLNVVLIATRPLWLSPRQCIIIPIGDKHVEYARQVQAQIKQAGYYVDIDSSDRTIPRRVREAQILQYNYMLIVGDDERTRQLVSIRNRDNLQQGMMKVDELIAKFNEQVSKYK